MNWWEHVWDKVEVFRAQHPCAKGDKLPVDVFTLIEINLQLDVIPFDDLFPKYSVDAALLPDFSGIYVDAESYMIWEKGPVWKQNRLRFTVAHELGHLVLHRTEAAKIKFHTFADFAGHFKSDNGLRYSLEQEANEFGGRLLVPVERLTQYYDEFAASVKAVLPNWRTSGDVRLAFGDSAGPKFGVHPQTITSRLEREGLWPAP